MPKLKVGINGLGRIGRQVLRQAFGELDIVGINGVGRPESLAHLLKYDSVHGIWDQDVSIGENALKIGDRNIKLSSTRDPKEIPWEQWGVDVVLECTGVFKSKAELQSHLDAGAKYVFVSAPAPGADFTLVYGVNHQEFDIEKHKTLSNASCTTNCLAPIVSVVLKEFGLEKAMMTTVHSYTNDQRILDSNHKDLRRARAAGVSMIPTTTGAAKALGSIFPEVQGRVDGMAIRVPTPNVSLLDFTFESQKKVSVKEINDVLTRYSENEFKGVLGVEALPLVSQDFMGRTESSIIDLHSTMVLSDTLVKIVSWYDNEAGFSSRMVDMIQYMEKQ